MAKVLVVNKVGQFQRMFSLPADPEVAAEFCQNALDGVWEIYQLETQQGDQNVSGNYKVAKITIRDEDTGEHTVLQMWVKDTVTEQDIKAALEGWTGAEDAIIQLFEVNTVEGEGSSSGS